MHVGVIGASGYLGAELLRLLAAHEEFDVAIAQADSTAGSAVADLYPALDGAYGKLAFSAFDPGALAGCDVVFVALPAGKSLAVVPELVTHGALVVDLGADFRLKDASLYPAWYGWPHTEPELLATAVYGLPELGRAKLPGATLIASPGCYVTAASIALAPLVANGVIEPHSIIVDAASGTSGAGKEPAPSSHFATVNENFSAYGVLTHRHTPEIEQAIGAPVLFTPHLAPMTRGILATCYARPSGKTSTAELLALFADCYADEPFVVVSEALPATRQTYGSNTLRLTARFDERTGTVVVLSAIDNLTKGGSGQAIQAANIALGLPETMGLGAVAVVP
jgi:N-acetyl-gamma-glutamyl-phosphate reductase